ncbi:hypothetical protein M419DRAFT_9207 [Trichoderma reesei RUT C-30]|uniref:Uncharacterized protein n=1 Tax=Hypocrea jecorina (strain ATCC 56765 / BCRC 32924 / NRRL 11460 / Rut C-30) TaxID=1344414 RepID=A0A024S6V2_HYPJR|nr:hypothetical protein M419DRAFT_9207 [Trichoderma reesei RUT C-30]
MAATEVQGSGVPRPRGVGVPQRVSRISSVLAETSQNKNGKCILAVVGMPTGASGTPRAGAGRNIESGILAPAYGYIHTS